MQLTREEFKTQMCDLAKELDMTGIEEHWKHTDMPSFTKEIIYQLFMKGKKNTYLEVQLYRYRLELDTYGFVEFK